MNVTHSPVVSAYHLPIDWRRAKFSLSHPSATPCGVSRGHDADSEMSIFIPVSGMTDILAIRDWLHDATNVDARYEMFGCYVSTHAKTTFIGMLFVFHKAMDLLLFQMFCQTLATVANPEGETLAN